MPTPPPWWIETHVAPAAVFTRALRSGQSATASEPSSIASVSRLGDATEPASRWSRPMTIGAATSPVRTSSLNARPGLGPLAVAEPADPGRQALERHPRLGHLDPAPEPGVVREQVEDRLVGAPDVGRVARQRGPAERAASLAELRPDERRHEPRDSRRRRSTPASWPPGRAGCCRSRRRPRRRAGTRASRGRGRPSTRRARRWYSARAAGRAARARRRG